MQTTNNRILIIGIGNNTRGDDGLGWKFIETVSGNGFSFLDCEYRYQLQIEDALMISHYDVVVFVDASHEKINKGFELQTCIASNHCFFFSHAQLPGAILCLTNKLYDKFPKAYTLAISGKEWDLQTSLSKQGENNLQAAIEFFTEEFLATVQDVAMS